MDCIKRAPLNFKATLVVSSSSTPNDMDDWVSDVEDDTTADLDDHDCPVVPITKEEKYSLRRPWHKTILIKLLGRSISYTTLLNRIKALWKPKSAIDRVVLDNAFFLSKFTTTKDYDFAKYGGPWIVFMLDTFKST